MKKRLIVLGLSLACIALLCYFLLPLTIGGLIFAVCFISGCIYIANYRRQQKQKIYWLRHPIAYDAPEFDNFFWELPLSSQDFYLHRIVKENGLNFLVDKYLKKLETIWQDPNLDLYQKTETSRTYWNRLSALAIIWNFKQ